jgi:hypothetical protein
MTCGFKESAKAVSFLQNLPHGPSMAQVYGHLINVTPNEIPTITFDMEI